MSRPNVLPSYSGAPINAVAEYPDPDYPVHLAVLAHRQRCHHRPSGPKIREVPAEPAARHFVMMRDGAMTAGCLFDPDLVCETFLLGVEGLLKAHAAPSNTKPAGGR
ncbi:TetR family transcriptional regulator [Actinacidiphila oryziradicis]|uniref:TetR family transcriptional regulator n=1 Tax=Actinacidiphila oryziradicis TaxID=2571141 RepID=A0A4U0SAR5_9ACTN|nr:TetR family transcriptional regulator [Actinacidiphila oryziradicis]TKA06420.1 TetR family transcriptional regulator [Actinacidiphila oryziradicis]